MCLSHQKSGKSTEMLQPQELLWKLSVVDCKNFGTSLRIISLEMKKIITFRLFHKLPPYFASTTKYLWEILQTMANAIYYDAREKIPKNNLQRKHWKKKRLGRL